MKPKINSPAKVDPETGTVHIDSIKPLKYKKPESLQDFMNSNGKDRIRYLKTLIAVGGPQWTEYLDFITDNLSGDIKTFSEENIKYIEKIKSEIDKKKSSELSGQH